MSFLDKPHLVWWRKVLFQVHLWAGVILCLYMLVIGVSGSILVLEDELEELCYGHLINDPDIGNAGSVGVPAVVATVQAAYPKGKIAVAYMPKEVGRNYAVFIALNGILQRVYVSPTTGCIVGILDPHHAWLTLTAQLHFRLLSGRTGFLLNGIGSACLLLLCISGTVIWWPGIRHWTRGLGVNFHRNWKRINFDLHGTTGIWTFLILSMWAATGVYFVWATPIRSLVGRFSSVEGVTPPKVLVPPRSRPSGHGLEAIIKQAGSMNPNARLAGVIFPGTDKAPLTILMARGKQGDFTKADYIYFDPSTGQALAVWHRGKNTSWGSRILWLAEPLHFGIYWGMAIKIVWATLGCALPILSITGVLMYWNRSLSKRWKTLRSSPKIQRSARSYI